MLARSSHRRTLLLPIVPAVFALLATPAWADTLKVPSDDYPSIQAAVDAASVYDFNATILHLMGLDHERLTYYHNGLERRLTNVHGHVVKDVLA